MRYCYSCLYLTLTKLQIFSGRRGERGVGGRELCRFGPATAEWGGGRQLLEGSLGVWTFSERHWGATEVCEGRGDHDV